MNAIGAGMFEKSMPAQTSGHPTSESLIESAIALLQERSPSEVTTDLVLKHSGVSKGSLYHHFEDLSDLLEKAMIRSFSAAVDENIALLSNLLSNAQNLNDYHRAIIAFNDHVQCNERRSIRLNRIGMLGHAVSSPRMANSLAKEQMRLTNAYIDLFEIAKKRGWISMEIDSHAGAVFIQSFTIGRVVDDICENTIDVDSWKELIIKVVTTLFFESQSDQSYISDKFEQK